MLTTYALDQITSYPPTLAKNTISRQDSRHVRQGCRGLPLAMILYPRHLLRSRGAYCSLLSHYMLLVLQVFAVLGFLSPANRGGLMTAMLLLFVFMGLCGGYAAGRLYRQVCWHHPFCL
jgi:Endomembrane protein 70